MALASVKGSEGRVSYIPTLTPATCCFRGVWVCGSDRVPRFVHTDFQSKRLTKRSNQAEPERHAGKCVSVCVRAGGGGTRGRGAAGRARARRAASFRVIYTP